MHDTNVTEELSNQWYNSTLYHWQDNEIRDNTYSIDTPPPTVSGKLHMGHIFSYCHTDFIARYYRMYGKNVFYTIGTDNNGLPTERLVESVLGKTAIEYRDEGNIEHFISHGMEIIKNAEQKYIDLFKAIGISFDFRYQYSTISDQSRDLAHDSYDDLLSKSFIYKNSSPVYWDVVDQTALSQADIIDKVITSKSYDIKFRTFANDTEIQNIVVMSTRPELIPSCVAIFYNPNDVRKSTLDIIGHKNIRVEISIKDNIRYVPVLGDDDVQIDKGTGFVMCCKYGDKQDVTWIQKHRENIAKDIQPIISKDGKIGDKSVIEARNDIVENLYQQKAIIDEIAIEHTVKCAERSGTPIEIIETQQVYVDIGFNPHTKDSNYKNDTISKLRKIVDCIAIHPAHMKNKLIQWIDGLNQDWCISRNRFLGIKISDTDLVFDTWFTSGSSPHLAIGTIRDTSISKKILPMDLRPQSHEIIRTWTFYTILKSYLHATQKDKNGIEISNINWDLQRDQLREVLIKKNIIPWTNIMLSGWCIAADGSKMSKSKNNITEPTELIQQFGADAVRYWASSVGPGMDTTCNVTILQEAKTLIIKLRNVVKFCNMHHKSIVNITKIPIADAIQNNIISEFADLWLIHSLKEMLESFEKTMHRYDYAKARTIVERYFLTVFCDYYIEIIKNRIYGHDAHVYNHIKYKTDDLTIEKRQKSAAFTLHYALKVILHAMAPFMPFITEELYNQIIDPEDRNLSFENRSIHRRASWPNLNYNINHDILKAGTNLVDIIANVRKHKANAHVSVKAPVALIKCQTLEPALEFDLRCVCNALDGEIVVAQNSDNIDVILG